MIDCDCMMSIKIFNYVLSFLLLSKSTYCAAQFNCDISTYYQGMNSDMSLWTKTDLGILTKSKHQDCLPYTSTAPDTWDAMKDLDPGATPNTVHLIYADIDVSADVHGTSDTWNREHTWPKSYGIDTSGCDYTDIHMLRPADATVNSARGNKFFGECGVVDIPSDCISPAHSEADITTERDQVVWAPPTHVRGDIARAMFYMDLRYYAGGDNDPDLVLEDCPTATEELGYLSILLKWHEDDPVSAEEIMRNERACTQWQGNRNPFVDYPELVKFLFGNARPMPTDGSGYDCNVAPPPTCNNNGQCEATENYLTCGDCVGSCNNDGNCDAGEDENNCPSDCSGGPVCGNLICDAGEDYFSCPTDCSCGDGVCETDEDYSTCPADCPCGDGVCDPATGEDFSTCPIDCSCGDGACDTDEDYSTCPTDCHCGDGVCNPAIGEDFSTCPTDCPGLCGNGICDSGEDYSSCPSDCLCGNGICDPNENCSNCVSDCPQKTKGKNQYCCDGNLSECGTASACNDVCHDNGGGDPPSGCGSSGEACASNGDCCSGNCKRNVCKGNGRRLGQPSTFLNELGRVY